MNSLPDHIQDTIYKYKHQMVFNDVMQELTGNVYVYGACPKCKENCDDEMPCWLDTLSQLKCDPEWVMTYGWKFKKDTDYKDHWYTLWKTGEYAPPEIDWGYYGWMDYLNDDNPNSEYSD